MPIATKPILAGSLLMGVGAIWIPRLTGTEVPWLPSGDTSPLIAETDPNDDTVESLSGTSPNHNSAVDPNAQLDSLADIVNYLEGRDGRSKPGAAPDVRITKAAIPVQGEDPTYVTEVDPLFGSREASDVDEEPTFEQQVQTYLSQNPLHTIIHGNGLTTATFGFQRVQVGSLLMDDQLEVTAIAQEFVTLTAEIGPMRVFLPPPGASTYDQRPAVPQPAPSKQPFSED